MLLFIDFTLHLKCTPMAAIGSDRHIFYKITIFTPIYIDYMIKKHNFDTKDSILCTNRTIKRIFIDKSIILMQPSV